MRIKTLIVLFIIMLIFPHNSFAEVESSDSKYNEFLKISENYNSYNIEADKLIFNPDQVLNKIFNIILYNLKDVLKSLSKTFLVMFSIIAVLSFVETFLTSEVIGKTVNFSAFVLCSVIICNIFETTAEIGMNCIHSIREYMNISFPVYVSILAGSGYTTASVAMRSIYIIFSNISVIVIDSVIIPALYLSAILGISSGISSLAELRKLSKTIIKISKFLIGIMLILFSTVLAFTGFITSSSDGILIKTAKLAVSNFVPLVGNCLSDTLNSVVYTSVLLKNMTGYIGVIIIIFAVLSPVIKFFVISVVFKLLSIFSSFLTDDSLEDIFDICTSVISVFMSVLIFISVIYILMFGTIIAIGGSGG